MKVTFFVFLSYYTINLNKISTNIYLHPPHPPPSSHLTEMRTKHLGRWGMTEVVGRASSCLGGRGVKRSMSRGRGSRRRVYMGGLGQLWWRLRDNRNRAWQGGSNFRLDKLCSNNRLLHVNSNCRLLLYRRMFRVLLSSSTRNILSCRLLLAYRKRTLCWQRRSRHRLLQGRAPLPFPSPRLNPETWVRCGGL
jgi:hypothetical protein